MDEFAAYRAAVAWIQSNIRGPAETPEQSPAWEVDERRRRRFARMHAFLRQLGNPERRFAAVHVAGTSGKGSTCALAAAMLQAAGKRTGLHVTPYLQTPLEKLLIDGRPMHVGRFVELVARVRREVEHFNGVSADGPLRYGELWVALTFAAYAGEAVQAGVVEVGLGGRWDCTNVITPAVAVINRVGLDHLRSLGPGLADIARHKAGIIKLGVPVVVAEQPPEALAVIEAEARALASPLLLAGRDFRWEVRAEGAEGGVFTYRDGRGLLPDLEVPLLGEHQVANAALAVAALRTPALALPDDAIRRGLALARFAGRLERVQEAPEVLLDGAHNAQKAQALAAALRRLRRGRRLVLVLGILTGHQPEAIVDVLAPLADAIVCSEPHVLGKAALPAADLAALCRRYCSAVETADEVAAATQRALDLAGDDSLVCVTGSLYLVGEARARWHDEQEILRSAWSDADDPAPADMATA